MSRVDIPHSHFKEEKTEDQRVLMTIPGLIPPGHSFQPLPWEGRYEGAERPEKP